MISNISIRTLTVLSVALLVSSSVFGAERNTNDDDKVVSTSKKAKLPSVPELETKAETKENFVARTSESEAEAQITWQVVSVGATEATVGSVTLSGTVGQAAIGAVSNGPNSLGQGYWYDFTPSCCVGIRGNTNSDPGETIMISDITYLVDYLFGIPSGPAPSCLKEGNANGDLSGAINVSDVAYLLKYLFGSPSGPPPPACTNSFTQM